MIFTWRGLDATTVIEEFLQLIDSNDDGLLQGKKHANIVALPNVAGIQGFADPLVSKTAQGQGSFRGV